MYDEHSVEGQARRNGLLPTEFAHVGITCRDPAALERFYVKHFGFERSRTVPMGNGEQIVFLKAGNVHLELFQAKEKATLPPPNNDGYAFPGLRHLAFSVPDVNAKLAELGADAAVKLGPLPFDNFIQGWRGVWVADPEGNIVELSQGYQDESPSPAPAEPRLVEEDWLVFEGKHFHHREKHSYAYDASGRKSRGRFESSENGESYAITYAYDESGRATGESWVNDARPSDSYAITYAYDAHGRFSGGKGVGAKSWTYHCHHDHGRQTEMRTQYTHGPSWTFVYSYDDTGRRVLGKGTATNGRSALITYNYQE